MKQRSLFRSPRGPRRANGPGLARRQFLKLACAATAAPLWVPASVLGRGDGPPPNDKINVGLIGTGNQGMAHAHVLVALPQVKLLAVCDPVRDKRLKARRFVENYYSGGTCADYADFRELLARKDIDAVVIASPEHWHALHTVAAAKAGKDIYCEKAMARTHAESRAMVRAVREHSRVFQLGTQQRSSARFRQACELAVNGYLGPLHTIKVGDPKGYPGPKVRSEPIPDGLDYELWLGPAPMSPYFPERLENLKGWMLCYDYTIGFMSGWGQHNLDIAQWGNGTDRTTPVEVEGRATFPSEGLNNTAQVWHMEFKYANGVKLIYTSDDETRYGIRFEGSDGWVFVDRERIEAQPESLLQTEFKGSDTRLQKSNHPHLDFFNSIRTRQDPVCPVDTGHNTYTICTMCDVAARLKRRLKWDHAAQAFVDDAEANGMLRRPMRAPWTL